MKNEKKSPEEIKNAIYAFLIKGPNSIKSISEEIGSNWSTVNSFLEDMKQEGKVKEVLSKDKIRIFSRADYPVFYGLTLEKETLNDSVYLFLKIIELWKKEYNSIPPKTTVQKIAVDVINECKYNLPVVDFHYGKVVPIFVEPDKDIEKIYQIKKPKRHKDLIECIEKIMPLHSNHSWKEKQDQYIKYKMNLFLEKERLINLLSSNEKNFKKIEETLFRFFMELPISDEDSHIINLFEIFLEDTIIILNSKDNEKYINEIRESFLGIWDLLTTHLFFNQTRRFISKEKITEFDVIKSSNLNIKILDIDSKITNFHDYSDSIDIKEIESILDKDSKELMKIMYEGVENE